MGKGKSSSGKHYTSKGERISSISTRDTAGDVRLMNQMAALRKGKNVVFTIENPNKEQTNKKFIRVKVNGKEFMKNFHPYTMKGTEA